MIVIRYTVAWLQLRMYYWQLLLGEICWKQRWSAAEYSIERFLTSLRRFALNLGQREDQSLDCEVLVQILETLRALSLFKSIVHPQRTTLQLSTG